MTLNDRHRGEARTAAIVIVVAMIGWMAFSYVGGRLGVPVQLRVSDRSGGARGVCVGDHCVF